MLRGGGYGAQSPRNSNIVGFQEFIGPKMGAEPPLDYFYPPPREKFPKTAMILVLFYFEEILKLMGVYKCNLKSFF